MTSEERVRAAIAFRTPDRIPIWNHNRDQMNGDTLFFDMTRWKGECSEWGYHFTHLDDGTMGQPKESALPNWDALEKYAFPERCAAERMAGVEDFKAQGAGKYLLGSLGISGFTTFSFLRGFENALLDIMLESPQAATFLDRIFAFETQLIELAAEAGLHGVHFSDDWGTQQGLMIAPDHWRSQFKERYRAQFQRAHELGLHVWFHCCGDLLDIAEDFHGIGVDVLNISQPNVVDIEKAGKRLRGKQCFMVPISYQTVSISGTVEEIHAEAQRLYQHLGTPEGGVVGYVEEYGCMGMSEENYQACGEAFRKLRLSK
jgi:uroporphyrinogen decarboxylase